MPTLSPSKADAPEREEASFRDPAGFLFRRWGTLYRQVNESGLSDYRQLIDSGLYEQLVTDRLLVPHREAELSLACTAAARCVLQPELIRMISYPYEWSFSQLKDAALATLDLQARALERGMSLKDASAYNIQFRHGRATLIDTLSFERYQEGRPWVAYRQFCQHFLAPLALMAKVDMRLGAMLRTHIDGIPLDLASRMLPGSTRLKWALLTHIHLHAAAQSHAARNDERQSQSHGAQVSRRGLDALVDSLRSAVEGLHWNTRAGVWGDYYNDTNYSEDAFAHKREIVESYLREIRPSVVWDLGANNGAFSRLAASLGAQVVSLDIEPAAVEANYRRCRDEGEERILPLLSDLANPSPNLGWAGEERGSLERRGPADVVMALALIHHLVIGNNTPMIDVARYFSRLGNDLIIEFVPKQDSQVQRLLSTRQDIFDDYTTEGFEAAFQTAFEINGCVAVRGACRKIYHLTARRP